jgi:2,3-bisphosphoglycerate-dependent phosphoglycerate mutase
LKTIWLVRHGESTANAGAATDNHMTIPLSPKGKEQAKQVSLLFEQSPDLIITSPFDRARQTAEPTLKRFPKVTHEIWDVHEFTYLSPITCVNTTADQRRERVNAYWNRLDPDYIDGEGAESFNMLLSRTKTAIERLNQLSNGLIVMFTHAQFIRAMRLLKDNPNNDAKQLMSQFRSLPRIENCEITKWVSK